MIDFLSELLKDIGNNIVPILIYGAIAFYFRKFLVMVLGIAIIVYGLYALINKMELNGNSWTMPSITDFLKSPANINDGQGLPLPTGDNQTKNLDFLSLQGKNKSITNQSISFIPQNTDALLKLSGQSNTGVKYSQANLPTNSYIESSEFCQYGSVVTTSTRVKSSESDNPFVCYQGCVYLPLTVEKRRAPPFIEYGKQGNTKNIPSVIIEGTWYNKGYGCAKIPRITVTARNRIN